MISQRPFALLSGGLGLQSCNLPAFLRLWQKGSFLFLVGSRAGVLCPSKCVFRLQQLIEEKVTLWTQSAYHMMVCQQYKPFFLKIARFIGIYIEFRVTYVQLCMTTFSIPWECCHQFELRIIIFSI